MFSLTPIVLTHNEEQNLAHTLALLSWAPRVVVLDSGSTDGTALISKGFPNVSFFVRRFDSFGHQWTFAFNQTGIASEYVLALDADMAVSSLLAEELKEFVKRGFAGGVIPIKWCYAGKPLLGSFCPPQLRVFRRNLVSASQIGHAHHFEVAGKLHRFQHAIWHEDRKPLERWLLSQANYSRLEAERLVEKTGLRCRDVVRMTGWMPAFAAVISYFKAGGPFGGKRALRYAWERATYEALLALRIIDRKLHIEEKANLRR